MGVMRWLKYHMDSPETEQPISTISKKHKHSFFDTLIELGTFEKLFVSILILLIVVSGTQILYKKNKATFIEIPRDGGTYVEGIIGTPRFINPLLAVSNADKDLTSLVYAGLLTRDADGNLIPELAESYTISEDGTAYTFKLKEGLVFHDGVALTADDVVYTINQASNPSMRSAVFSNWEGITVEKVDNLTVTFTLPEPYAPFIENFTLGILPAHIWSDLTPENVTYSEFNKTPVGAGPFKFGSIERTKSGIPLQYNLERFEGYTLGAPYIHTIEFILYDNNEDALTAYTQGKLDALHNIAPVNLEVLLNSNTNIQASVHRAPLLRTFGIFLNHNQQRLFLEDEVLEALKEATPKKAIVGEILRGYGTVIDSPLPTHLLASEDEITLDTTTATNSDETEGGIEEELDEAVTEETVEEAVEEIEEEKVSSVNSIERARAILENEGWRRGEDGVYVYKNDDSELRLSMSLSTVNTPELVQAAQRIAESWREVGFEVELKVFDPTDLTQSVIRPRKFDALLFGMVIGHELDLYAFWHSSQRNDPGLNIAQYADIDADALLEQMRTEQDAQKRTELYREFVALIQKQNPAIFLYTPDFTYLVNNRVNNVSIHPLSEASERFDTVHTWYLESDNVWPFMEQLLKR